MFISKYVPLISMVLLTPVKHKVASLNVLILAPLQFFVAVAKQTSFAKRTVASGREQVIL